MIKILEWVIQDKANFGYWGRTWKFMGRKIRTVRVQIPYWIRKSIYIRFFPNIPNLSCLYNTCKCAYIYI